MSSHHSTVVVPEDVSHLHSHTSGPTNLHSIRLVLPKHPFDHDTAWVKQLQPRQHSSNKYLSFGSLGCGVTATLMWISHFARPLQCSELGWDAGAEQQAQWALSSHSGHSWHSASSFDCMTLSRGFFCVLGRDLYFSYLQVGNCDCPSHRAHDPEFSRHQWWSRSCPPDWVPSCLELVLLVQAILCLFQNSAPAPGSFSAFSLPPVPNTGKRTVHWFKVRGNASWRPSNHNASLSCGKFSSFKYC